ncbi:MAG: hypothetical protein KGH59_02605 [Candidatus Micrarchaeota archaeon]|nr:hypothetical protein [Candidatus Micrarchaeota archaeon]MDE1804648.1 hypothetical protein [Candidatus Micrarchaeota archaeon]MDE1847030.1 hypothetical protein [Candidatus Micrarchaeota archaeon]
MRCAAGARKHKYDFSSRRTKVDVAVEIIELCKTPKIISHISQNVNVAPDIAKEFVGRLVDAGILEVIQNEGPKMSGSRTYVCTPKGYEVLELFRQLSEILRP